MKMIYYWNKLSRNMVVSLSLDVFRSRMDAFLEDILKSNIIGLHTGVSDLFSPTSLETEDSK